ncbi:hypothetical protein IW262DRAFT_514094 [Armillaria fumosa]|nr:hypothetical protein IW262DRAFT_514094 [Armillaria fumosa]
MFLGLLFRPFVLLRSTFSSIPSTISFTLFFPIDRIPDPSRLTPNSFGALNAVISPSLSIRRLDVTSTFRFTAIGHKSTQRLCLQLSGISTLASTTPLKHFRIRSKNCREAVVVDDPNKSRRARNVHLK